MKINEIKSIIDERIQETEEVNVFIELQLLKERIEEYYYENNCHCEEAQDLCSYCERSL